MVLGHGAPQACSVQLPMNGATTTARARGLRTTKQRKGTRSNGERFDAQVVKVVPGRGRIKEGLGSREYHGRAVVHM